MSGSFGYRASCAGQDRHAVSEMHEIQEWEIAESVGGVRIQQVKGAQKGSKKHRLPLHGSKCNPYNAYGSDASNSKSACNVGSTGNPYMGAIGVANGALQKTSLQAGRAKVAQWK